MDLSIQFPEPGSSGSPAFDLWLRIVKTLNLVIGLYRPTNPESNTGWEHDYPGFEQIVDEMHGWNLPMETLETLRMFYLSTAVLAHRLKSIKTLPHSTPSRLRQQLSAVQIIRNMTDERRIAALHPFPFIVYAASLALSVSFQQLRYSRLRSHQEDARRDFNSACDILRHLMNTWAAADHIAGIAQRISIEINQMPNLDVLYINNTKVVGNEGVELHEEQTSHSANFGPEQFSALVQTESSIGSADIFDLFEGMDDISWMYLDFKK
ncbi:hypothetical protein QQS21_012683 [Conoideocrella luteorostrata]|uniref:Transcription factor domain-containing protein n=1 Tax=Conoideocrella luteorostrata TaxID=1105319 RepID=A0AAJ0CAQ5_9HYPO|nr:hypothetical protein QQS21_012683 [Conoideocrella luteorostrata]